MQHFPIAFTVSIFALLTSSFQATGLNLPREETLVEKCLSVLVTTNVIRKPRGILDIGAHDGSWTKSLKDSLVLDEGNFFIQIEANKDMLPALAASGHGYIHALLGDIDEQEVDYYKSNLNALSDCNSIYPYKPASFRRSMTIERVSMVTLDTLLSVVPRGDDTMLSELEMDVMKINTCGSELLVLKGAVELIKRSKPVIILEVNTIPIFAGAPTFIDIHIYMESIGYVIADIVSETYNVSPDMEVEATDDPDVVSYNGIEFNQKVYPDNLPLQLRNMGTIWVPREQLAFQGLYTWPNNNYTCTRTKKVSNRNKLY